MGLKKLCRSWVHRGGGLASQAAGTPRRRGLRKRWPGWMWRQQPQCAPSFTNFLRLMFLGRACVRHLATQT